MPSTVQQILSWNIIKHMFVSTCLEKVITENCPTNKLYSRTMSTLKNKWTSIRSLSTSRRNWGNYRKQRSFWAMLCQGDIQTLWICELYYYLQCLSCLVSDWIIITTIIIISCTILHLLSVAVLCLIIRSQIGIYNNDINWRSRSLLFIKNVKNIRCNILIKC